MAACRTTALERAAPELTEAPKLRSKASGQFAFKRCHQLNTKM
jgi:hypothetical protein